MRIFLSVPSLLGGPGLDVEPNCPSSGTPQKNRVSAFAGIAALLLALPSPALEQSTSANDQPASQSPQYDAALVLAKALRSEENMVAESRYAFEGQMATALQKDKNVATLEGEYPGITNYMLTAMRSEIEQQIVSSLPILWKEMATLISSEMSLSEIGQAHQYYTSPSGRRLVASVLSHYDYGGLVSDTMKSSTFAVTPHGIKSNLESRIGKVIAEMTVEDKQALMVFTKTSAFTKIQALNPRILDITASWANRSTPEEEARLDTIAVDAAETFMAENDKKAGRR